MSFLRVEVSFASLRRVMTSKLGIPERTLRNTSMSNLRQTIRNFIWSSLAQENMIIKSSPRSSARR